MEGDRRRKAIISGSEQPTNELKLPVGTQLASQDFWSLICSQRPAATQSAATAVFRRDLDWTATVRVLHGSTWRTVCGPTRQSVGTSAGKCVFSCGRLAALLYCTILPCRGVSHVRPTGDGWIRRCSTLRRPQALRLIGGFLSVSSSSSSYWRLSCWIPLAHSRTALALTHGSAYDRVLLCLNFGRFCFEHLYSPQVVAKSYKYKQTI